MKKLLFYSGLALLLFSPNYVFAHCPLCTAGAAAAGGIAYWLGVSVPVIGIFLGAASLSLGWWVAKGIKRKFFPLQTEIITIGFFVSVIIPLLPLFAEYTSLYVALSGAYGSWLHRVYLINLFLLGSLLGAAIALISPTISKRITKIRQGKFIPYQGIATMFALLGIISLVVEFWL